MIERVWACQVLADRELAQAVRVQKKVDYNIWSSGEESVVDAVLDPLVRLFIEQNNCVFNPLHLLRCYSVSSTDVFNEVFVAYLQGAPRVSKDCRTFLL